MPLLSSTKLLKKKEYVEKIVEINQKEQMMQLFCK